ncbi:hypothetical protein I250019C1_11830 [Faecalibacterium sp. i25-0019-C1]|uniref:hypothetical protein n=1 Tax=Faecalibacterium sp. i25-0019-C1 TaxID=3141185 RepID=UPI0036F37E66
MNLALLFTAEKTEQENWETAFVAAVSLTFPDASKSNAIYGRSATVQPAAYYVHIWRRVA